MRTSCVYEHPCVCACAATQVWDMHLVGTGTGPSSTLRGMTAAVNDVAFTSSGAHVSQGGSYGHMRVLWKRWLWKQGVGHPPVSHAYAHVC